MAEIETEHQGYKITFGGNSEEWSCRDIDFSHKSLATVKSKIDKFLLETRRVDRVAAIKLGGYSPWPVVKEKLPVVTVTSIDSEEAKDRNGDKGPQVWVVEEVVSRTGFSTNKTRSREKLANLAPVGPETDAAYAHWANLHAAAQAANKAVEAAYAAIPRLTLEHLGKEPAKMLTRVRTRGRR